MPCICNWFLLALGLLKSWSTETFPNKQFRHFLMLLCLSHQPAPGSSWILIHFPHHSRKRFPILKLTTSLELFKELFKAPQSFISVSFSSMSGGSYGPGHIFWSWGGWQEPLVLPAGGLLLPCGGDTVLFPEPRVGLSLSARFRRAFFYCPCQLAAQGYCQLSVRALIFVSYGQVLLVICNLFSFVQAELYLSTN